MRVFLRFIWVALVAIAVLAGGFYGSGYLWSLRGRASVPELPDEAAVAPAGAIEPGGECVVSVAFSLPFSRRLIDVKLTPPPGFVQTGEPRVESSLGWSHRRYVCRAALRAELPPRSASSPGSEAAAPIGPVALPGAAEGGARGEFTLGFSPVERNEDNYIAEVPLPRLAIESSVPTAEAELALADAIDLAVKPSFDKRWYWLALVLLIPAALVLYRFFRRGGKAAEVPLWDRALAALAALRGELTGGKLAPEAGFVRLADLVRGYLEQRFHLPVTTRTTPEFLSGLERGESQLPEADRPALKRFLNAADLVKFAKAPPDTGVLDDAISSAEALVRHTAVQPDTAEPHAGGGDK